MAGVRARIDRLNDAPTEERLARLDATWKEAQKLEGFKAMGATNQAIFDLEDQVDTAMQGARAKIEQAKAEGTTLTTPAKVETKPDETPPQPAKPETKPAKRETKAKKTEPAKPKKVKGKRPKVENNPEEDDLLAAVALLGGIDREQADAQYGFKDYHNLRGKGPSRY